MRRRWLILLLVGMAMAAVSATAFSGTKSDTWTCRALPDSAKDEAKAHGGGEFVQFVTACRSGKDTGVAVVQKRVKDDSIQALRHHVVLVLQEGDWIVAAHPVHSQKCRPDRGHRFFSTAPCV